MSLVTIQKDLDESMVTLLAGSVVNRLFIEIEKLSDSPDVDDTWLSTIKDLFVFAGNIETGFGHGRSFALAVIKRNWDKLPFETRSKLGYDFMNFARTWTGRERSTIDNYILTANVWFIDKVRPDHSVRVMERDGEGRPVLDAAGNVRYNYVEFNPFLVDFSKLLIVNSRAAKGEMTDRLWELLTDPYYTCEDVRVAHVQTKTGGELPDVYFTSMGTGIFIQHGGETAHIAELNWDEYETNLVVKEGIDRLFRLLHLKMDEDYIFDLTRERNKALEKENATTGHNISRPRDVNSLPT